MAEIRDPTIKLFGRTIPLSDVDLGTIDQEEDICIVKESRQTAMDDLAEPAMSSVLTGSHEDHQTSSQDDKLPTESKLDEEKILKKPDKILPCPRCKSLDTKFCYYNNYNVNQPRYFCKNCQRYWTAGGTMRNVPVGAGRRKSKNCGQLHGLSVDIPAVIRPSVLSFSPETQLNPEESTNFKEAANESSSSQIPEKPVPEGRNEYHGCCHNGLAPMQYMPAPPWPYWGHSDSDQVTWIPQALFAPGIPFPFMPASYWPNGAWNVPWNGSPTDNGLKKDDKKSEKSLWTPKALKIDDPDEAAKSSIWSTLGIKPDISMKRSGIFRPFQSDNETRVRSSANVRNLHANPAALSRSQLFQETT